MLQNSMFLFEHEIKMLIAKLFLNYFVHFCSYCIQRNYKVPGDPDPHNWLS